MIDTNQIKRSYKISEHTKNLRQVGRYQVGPCPLCGGVDRFTIKPTDEGEVWFCRNCGDDRYHDVIELVKRLNNCGFIEAINILAGGNFTYTPAVDRQDVPLPPKLAEIPAQSWQDKAMAIWSASHERLIESLNCGEINPYLSWLMNRGITPKEVRKFGLGYHPGGAGLARGIVIPAFFNGDILYLKVRKRGQKKVNKAGKTVLYDKYRQLAGGKSNSLFNADSIKPGIKQVVIVEGEFDAIVVSRFVPSNTAVVTMGSTSQVPEFTEWGYLFAAVEKMFIYQDGDKSGQKALLKWVKMYPYAEKLIPLGNGDPTDYWKAQGYQGMERWLKMSGVT